MPLRSLSRGWLLYPFADPMILWPCGMLFGTQIFSRAFSWSFQPGQAFTFSKVPDSFSSIASSHTVSSWASSCSLPDDIPMISHAGVRIVVRGVLGYPQEASSRVEEAKKAQAVQLGVWYFKPQMIIMLFYNSTECFIAETDNFGRSMGAYFEEYPHVQNIIHFPLLFAISRFFLNHIFKTGCCVSQLDLAMTGVILHCWLQRNWLVDPKLDDFIYLAGPGNGTKLLVPFIPWGRFFCSHAG